MINRLEKQALQNTEADRISCEKVKQLELSLKESQLAHQKLLEQCRELQSKNAEMEYDFQLEMQTHVKLVELYKKSAEEKTNKITEIEKIIGELEQQKNLVDMKYREEVSLRESIELDLDNKTQTLRDEIGYLKEELANANNVLTQYGVIPGSVI